MAARIESPTIGPEAEFALRILGNVRSDLRGAATDLKARLAAGRETPQTAIRALRSVGKNVGETLRSFVADTRAAHDAAILSDLGVTGAQLAGAVNALLANVLAIRDATLGSRADLNAFCDQLLVDCGEADAAGDAAFTRILKGAARHTCEGVAFDRREQSFTDAGINFRINAAYVTDGTGETYTFGDLYPSSRSLVGSGESVTMGWDSFTGLDARERSAAIDRRLAGFHMSSNSSRFWRLDIPSTGTWDVYFAAGDNDNGHDNYNIDVRDGASTVLFNCGGGTQDTAAAHWIDASGADQSLAAWPGSNAKYAATFANTNVRIYTLSAGNDPIAHIRVTQAIPVLAQTHFRFRKDDGDEAGASGIAAEDTGITRPADSPARLRTQVDETAGHDPASRQFQIEYRQPGYGQVKVPLT